MHTNEKTLKFHKNINYLSLLDMLKTKFDLQKYLKLHLLNICIIFHLYFKVFLKNSNLLNFFLNAQK
jgi:peptidase E